MTVDYLLRNMSSREMAEWIAYNRVQIAEYENERQRSKQEASVRSKQH